MVGGVVKKVSEILIWITVWAKVLFYTLGGIFGVYLAARLVLHEYFKQKEQYYWRNKDAGNGKNKKTDGRNRG